MNYENEKKHHAISEGSSKLYILIRSLIMPKREEKKEEEEEKKNINIFREDESGADDIHKLWSNGGGYYSY